MWLKERFAFEPTAKVPIRGVENLHLRKVALSYDKRQSFTEGM